MDLDNDEIRYQNYLDNIIIITNPNIINYILHDNYLIISLIHHFTKNKYSKDENIK